MILKNKEQFKIDFKKKTLMGYHFTKKENYDSIKENGLQIQYATKIYDKGFWKTILPAVYLFSCDNIINFLLFNITHIVTKITLKQNYIKISVLMKLEDCTFDEDFITFNIIKNYCDLIGLKKNFVDLNKNENCITYIKNIENKDIKNQLYVAIKNWCKSMNFTYNKKFKDLINLVLINHAIFLFETQIQDDKKVFIDRSNKEVYLTEYRELMYNFLINDVRFKLVENFKLYKKNIWSVAHLKDIPNLLLIDMSVPRILIIQK